MRAILIEITYSIERRSEFFARIWKNQRAGMKLKRYRQFCSRYCIGINSTTTGDNATVKIMG
jgi:hypothetical protein